jgi:hypothetical protein
MYKKLFSCIRQRQYNLITYLYLPDNRDLLPVLIQLQTSEIGQKSCAYTINKGANTAIVNL